MSDYNIFGILITRLVRKLTRSSVVAERQRGRAMISVRLQLASIVQYLEYSLLLVTSASDLPMRATKFCSVFFVVPAAVINKIH